MSKTHKIISLSVEPQTVEMLDNARKKMGWSRSDLVRRLVHKHLNLLVNDSDETPVILRVPADIKGDPEALRDWLNKKVEGIVKALG